MNRGVERRDIFLKGEDYAFFLSQAKELLPKHGIAILSYCLMPNHFHFLLAVGDVELGKAMHQLEATYSMYFNRVYERVGHLFQDRFKSIEVSAMDYLCWLPVYIHRNPVRARLTRTLEEWEWCGHGELMSSKKRFLDLSALSRFGSSPAQFQKAYREQVIVIERPLPDDASLDEILQWSAMACGIRWQDVVAGARGGPFTRAKRLVAAEAKERGFTVTEIAAKLGVTPGALSHRCDEAATEKCRQY